MSTTDPRNITRELLLDLRQPLEVTLSPAGDRIAFVATDTSKEKDAPLVCRVWAGPADGPLDQVTDGPGSDTHPHFSPDGSKIAFASDRGHIGRMSLYILDDSGESRTVGAVDGTIEELEWSVDGSQIFVLTADMGSDSAGAHISRVIEEEGAASPDPIVKRPEQTWRRIFAIDVVSGETTQVTPEGVNVWEFAGGSERLAAIVSNQPHESLWYDAYIAQIDPSTRGFKEVYRPEWQLQSPRPSPDGKRIAFVEGATSDRLLVTATITVVELATGKAVQLAPDRDVTKVWWAGTDRLAFVGRRAQEMHCGFVSLDGQVEEVWSGPEQLGQVHFTDMATDREGKRFAAARDAVGVPPEVCVLETAGATPAWREITSLNQALRAIPVPNVRELSWKSDDGLEIQGLVLTPADSGPDPLPLAVVVHGGPSANWSYCFAPGYAANAICFVNAGYAVLLPNHRGSTGRGPEFARANIGDLGGGDFRDILTGVDACVEAGIADGNRVGITGCSAGGLMTAWAVTQTDRFAAAIPVSVISNWLSFQNTGNISRFNEIFLQADPYEPAGAYFHRSPVVHCRNATTPTLVMHGEIDLVTPRTQAQEFYQAISDAGCVAELIVYPREGHGHAWLEREHLRDCWNRQRDWFDRYLDFPVEQTGEQASVVQQQ